MSFLRCMHLIPPYVTCAIIGLDGPMQNGIKWTLISSDLEWLLIQFAILHQRGYKMEGCPYITGLVQKSRVQNGMSFIKSHHFGGCLLIAKWFASKQLYVELGQDDKMIHYEMNIGYTVYTIYSKCTILINTGIRDTGSYGIIRDDTGYTL